MIFKHTKGKHRAWPLYWLHWFILLYKPVVIRRKVMFHNSCNYQFNDEDQFDVNKLFGVSLGRVHMNSVRFGWRYVPETGKIQVYTYYYLNGQMDFKIITDCRPYIMYGFHIVLNSDEFIFIVDKEGDPRVTASVKIPRYDKIKWAYLLGPFFGGNKPAPHKMQITIKKY